jgi:hypothetical protein
MSIKDRCPKIEKNVTHTLKELGHAVGSSGPHSASRIGSSINLYGVFNFNVLGTILVTYTMDSFPVNKTYSVDDTMPEFTNGVKQLENYPLYSNNAILVGDHTLHQENNICLMCLT